MELALNLDQMTVADKLAAMERLWEDLGRTPEAVPSPSWHGEVLSAREKRVSEGKAAFSPLDEVKERIRKAIR
ncbi:MAG: addiction module protein [Thermodesulfobacteriota bacterium]